MNLAPSSKSLALRKLLFARPLLSVLIYSPTLGNRGIIDMKQPQRPSKGHLQQSEYWMRSISFAGLHRILKAVAVFPNGLRAGELNKLVQEKEISLTRRSSPPAPTTLYHYRNALLHLGALKTRWDVCCVSMTTTRTSASCYFSRPRPTESSR